MLGLCWQPALRVVPALQAKESGRLRPLLHRGGAGGAEGSCGTLYFTGAQRNSNIISAKSNKADRHEDRGESSPPPPSVALLLVRGCKTLRFGLRIARLSFFWGGLEV